MRAIELLNSRLHGNFISHFSVGDIWCLYLGEYWLFAQNVVSEDEILLNQLLHKYYPSAQKTVDKEYISKCAIIASHMRKEVTGLQLDEVCNLTIEFEQDSKLIIPTNTQKVDWQWCLNKSGTDPYHDYIIAYFWKGEIEINED